MSELLAKFSVDDSLFMNDDLQLCRVDDPSKAMQQEHLDFIEHVLADWEKGN